MKKYLPYILTLIMLIGLFSPMKIVGAVENCSNHELSTRELCIAGGGIWTPDPGYQLLAPLPCEYGDPGCVDGKLVTFNPAQPNNLGAYLNLMIKIVIGLAAVLSVVMIVIGGIEYMTSELISSKEAGKERIKGALLGLIIALGAYTLLFTINPDLLETEVCTSPQVKQNGQCVTPTPSP